MTDNIDSDANPANAKVFERLGRFDHHPDPAIDFCIEVEEIQSIAWDRAHNVINPDDRDLHRRIEAAMKFRVGGDEGAVKAKWLLRQIEASVMMADGAGNGAASTTDASQVPGIIHTPSTSQDRRE